MTQNDKIAMRMEGITKRFPGVLANDRISLECRKGEVLGLLGENGAGKTTLMNILYGLHQPDSGKIFINGKQVTIESPAKAIELGIGMVHQHFKLVDTLTALENVILGIPSEHPLVLDLAPARKRFLALCEEYDLYVDPSVEVWRLSVGKQQWLEILKALYRDARLLVLDEPSAVLTPAEGEQLFKAIRKLTAEERSVIFISHKFGEVLEITDRITVIRDGHVVGTVPTKEATYPELARMMVGRPVAMDRKSRPLAAKKDPILVMENVEAMSDRGLPALKNINLTLHPGEIVGVAGVDGNGQLELAECIVGMRKRTSGTIRIQGLNVDHVMDDPSFVGYIPADRQKVGLFLALTVAENLIVKDYYKAPFARKSVLRYSAIRQHAKDLIKDYNIKTPSGEVEVANLSGGNQQKVVIARELSDQPAPVVASQATRGLDLGAVESVHNFLLAERERGAAVLFISTELQEVMSLSDRIIVMFRGEVMGEVDGNTADVDTIGQMMLGETAEVSA
ncbi:MAG: ABC transporter ATP-binding protein [Anaerolineaceae bacterium]|nr:ABC transporter ATP-binding protein [Anaerolineaceae bacterium]